MDFTRECLYFKAKSMASTLYGIMLWASNFPSSPTQATTNYDNFARGKNISHFSLIAQITPPRILHSYMIPPSQPLLPTSSSTSLSSSSSSLFVLSTPHSTSSLSTSSMGDLIGTESGVYTSSIEDILTKEFDSVTDQQGSRQVPKKMKTKKMKHEYPPPIPSMARTGNLTGRMPWVLSRDYVNGRLVIKMDEVNRHEYFEADRSNGRLVLKLTPLDKCMDDDVNTIYDDNGLLESVVEEGGSSPMVMACSVPQSCRDDGWLLKSGDDSCAYERMCFTYAGEPTNFGSRRISNAKTDRDSVTAFNFRRVAPMASVM